MNTSIRLLAATAALLLVSCATRTPFSPGGPTTVGMPANLSDRERSFIPEIDSALRREGLVPVRYGRGDLQLDFSMASGPINIDTRIALSGDGGILVSGNGRAAGAPLIGRSSVAQKSFDRAFEEFNQNLSGAAGSLGWPSSSSSEMPGQDYPAGTGYDDNNLPVY